MVEACGGVQRSQVDGLGELLPLFCVVILVFSFFFFYLLAHGGRAPCWYACLFERCQRLLLMVLFLTHPTKRTDVLSEGEYAVFVAREDSMIPCTRYALTI